MHMIIKSTLDETSNFGPSAAVVDGRHYMAWVGLDGRLNVLQLGGPKLTLDTNGLGGIALAGRPGTDHDLAIAWTDPRTSLVFVAPGFSNPLNLDVQFEMPTRVTSFTAPALAAFKGVYF